MTPEDLVKSQEIRAKFLSKEEVLQHIEVVLHRGLKFHASLWSEDLKERAANMRYMKKHPQEWRARERSFALFLAKFGPTKELEPPPKDPRDITPEKLDGMGLSESQIKTLAGIDEKE